KLEKEKLVIGFYLSAHPLDTYKKQLKRLTLSTFADALEKSLNNNSMQEIVTVGCGLLKSRRDIFTKKGDRMSFVQLEDSSGTSEIILFPRTFKKVEHWLDDHNVFIVKGAVDNASERKCKIKANELIPIDLFLKEWPVIHNVLLTLPNNTEEPTIQNLREKLVKGKIPLSFIFHENGKKLQLRTREKIAIDIETVHSVEESGIEVKFLL
ncbi:hypothetical protein KAH94_03820, partial [bacterium]|nr:hypothetical protein [bacterium]